MPNVDELIYGVSQIVTERKEGTLCFTVLDLKYAYSQINWKYWCYLRQEMY